MYIRAKARSGILSKDPFLSGTEACQVEIEEAAWKPGNTSSDTMADPRWLLVRMDITRQLLLYIRRVQNLGKIGQGHGDSAGLRAALRDIPYCLTRESQVGIPGGLEVLSANTKQSASPA